VVGSDTGIYKVGWFSDWKASGLIGVAIVCSIIAIAAMMGKAFNLPTVKAFANNEIKQAVISVMLIVSLIALISFFDEVADLAIDSADLPINCAGAEPCYIVAAKHYLTTLYDTGGTYAKNELMESIQSAKRASYGYNLNFNKIYFAFAGFSIRYNAGDSLVAERHGALFTQVSKIMVSLYAQRYFIDVITFGIAPLFILLGIVLRTFFFTRKLGGLMLAIAISLFIIYPLTFAFAWYTLNVTVYGERTLAVADPNCPGECTATYPVAFFVNPDINLKGQLVQFPTTQAMIRAGINATNWEGGDVNGDGTPEFPGLVACRNLTSLGISSAIAPNSCSECPDYCRDVPFPTGMPGCNITKCASCNPGCKMVRQRLNCETDPDCVPGSCPLYCRTRLPTENKCFSNETGGIIAANMSVSCSGCDDFPAWCRFLRVNETTGELERVYNDPQLNKMCEGVDDPARCPSQCQYITTMSPDMSCDNICSVEDQNTGVQTICPKECRVVQIFNSSWASIYDTAPPNFTSLCNATTEIGKACTVCSKHPECLVEVKSRMGCAPFPTVAGNATSCLACPDYCRREDFTGVFTIYSKVERNAAGLPSVCNTAKYPEINCSATGDPPACNASCRTSPALPDICRSYAPGSDKELCKGCPDTARYKVQYVKNGTCPGGALVPPVGVIEVAAPADEHTVLLYLPQQSLAAIKPSGAQGASRLAGKYDGTIWFDIATTTLSARINPNESAIAGSPLQGWCNGTADSGQAGSAKERQGITYFMGGSKHVYWLDWLPVKYDFKWYKNGVLNATGITDEVPSGVETLASTPPGSNTSAGDTWTFSCRAYHSAASTGIWLNSTNVTIQALNPLMVSARISPPLPNTSSNLVGWCNATEIHGSQVQYNFTWKLNGTVNSSGQSSFTQQGVEAFLSNVFSPLLVVGQNWSFSCMASNGTANSSWLESSNVTILVLPEVIMNSSNITVSPPSIAYRNSTLLGYCNATDTGDLTSILTYQYRWYKNDVLNTSGSVPGILQGTRVNIANITNSSLKKNQIWIFSCRANNSDGLNSTWLNSTSVQVMPNLPEANCTMTNSSLNLSSGYDCSNAKCNFSTCFNPTYVRLWNEGDDPACQDQLVTECPYGCRVLGANGQLDPMLAPECTELCSELLASAPQCFVNGALPQPDVPICNEYYGNGGASCHGAICTTISTQSACAAAVSSGCSWQEGEIITGGYCDNSACIGKPQGSCTGYCGWVYTDLSIPILARNSPYDVRGECRQCPEQCRVDSYEGACGAKDNDGYKYTDCSMEQCPLDCRIPQPLPSSVPPRIDCQPYPENSGQACLGCPALCRTNSNVLSVETCPDQCQLSSDPNQGCTDICRMDEPPDKACEGCFNCNPDCSFYPAIRTDCSDICSDEALAGPVNIDPNDFVKSLPGASTSQDGLGAKNVGLLYIPALLLPLFCIVIVVAFIRILSPILGGDIEIPGLGRII